MCNITEAEKQNIIELVREHKKHCNCVVHTHEICPISTYSVYVTLLKAGCTFTDEERKVFY